METFSIYVAIKANTAIHDSIVDMVAGQLRPDDEEMCVWRDEDDASVLCVSTDVQALDYEAGLDVGRAIGEEALRLPGIPSKVDRVVAMSEEGQLEWRPRSP